MKKTLILFILLTPIYILADLTRDPKTLRYYSIPARPEINQLLYHTLVWDCKDIQKFWAEQQQALNNYMAGRGNGSYRNTYGHSYIANEITQYLVRIATPTAIRLLEDLRKINFSF